MSTYTVNYLCREALRDHGFREALRADPAVALADKDLTDAERAAFAAGEVGTLLELGANEFLMGYLVRFELLGLTLESYRERLQAGAARMAPPASR